MDGELGVIAEGESNLCQNNENYFLKEKKINIRYVTFIPKKINNNALGTLLVGPLVIRLRT